MATKLIQLEGGVLVAVEVSGEQVEQISGKLAEKVDASIDKLQATLVKLCRPIATTWNELSQEIRIEQAEVEVGLSFEAEGNLYVTSSKASANFTVKLLLKPARQ